MQTEQILQKIFEKMCDIEKRQMTLLEINKYMLVELMTNNKSMIKDKALYQQRQKIYRDLVNTMW